MLCFLREKWIGKGRCAWYNCIMYECVYECCGILPMYMCAKATEGHQVSINLTSKIPLRQVFSPKPGTHFCASLICHQANCLHLFSPNHWGLQDHVLKDRFCECEKDLNWSCILVQKCSSSLRYLPILPFAYFLMKLFVFL